jgi:putative transposase
MTYLPTHVIGQWFYLYLILDLYSRKIVGFTVEVTDNADHAAHLVKRTALAEGIHSLADKPVLHGDNGSTLKATTVLAMLHWLGVKPSYSRPRVSDDNAYAEALFRTAKYRPEFPAKGFAAIDVARLWGSDFVRWYNTEHRHGGIRYVTPEQRHAGAEVRQSAADCGNIVAILMAVQKHVYERPIRGGRTPSRRADRRDGPDHLGWLGTDLHRPDRPFAGVAEPGPRR